MTPGDMAPKVAPQAHAVVVVSLPVSVRVVFRRTTGPRVLLPRCTSVMTIVCAAANEGLRSLASRLQPSWKFRRLYACAAHGFGQVDPAADKFRTDLDKFGQGLRQICPISPEF